MTCLCIDELRPASFRGAPFFVASDKGEYGRRGIIHEYPMRDDPYIEDMGQKATKFTVSGYLAGDDWISQKDALVAACTAFGPALLMLPTEAPVPVVCLNLSVSRSKDECGFYGLSLDFVVAKNFGLPSIFGVFESLIGAIFFEAIPALTTMFDHAYSGDNVAQYATERQSDRITDFASTAISIVESNPTINDELASDAVRASIALYQNAEDYVAPDPVQSVTFAAQPEAASIIRRIETDTGYTQIGDAGVDITNGASTIVPLVAYILNSIANAMTPEDVVTAFTPLAQWGYEVAPAEPVTGTVVSRSDSADYTNSVMIGSVVRLFALIKLAQAISAIDFKDRASALQARATIVELFNTQIALLEEDEVVNVVVKARDCAVRSVSQKMANIVPLLMINAPESRPSLYWAGRLYEDASRAEELADRNHATLPAFMPPYFEALAR